MCIETIYIPLVDEGTDVLRPVNAVRLDQQLYQILLTEEYDSDDEKWKFPPGTIVRCREEIRAQTAIILAVDMLR
jgi:hypothetical protein